MGFSVLHSTSPPSASRLPTSGLDRIVCFHFLSTSGWVYMREVPAWEGLCFEINDLPAADNVEQMENDLPPLLHKRACNKSLII